MKGSNPAIRSLFWVFCFFMGVLLGRLPFEECSGSCEVAIGEVDYPLVLNVADTAFDLEAVSFVCGFKDVCFFCGDRAENSETSNVEDGFEAVRVLGDTVQLKFPVDFSVLVLCHDVFLGKGRCAHD